MSWCNTKLFDLVNKVVLLLTHDLDFKEVVQSLCGNVDYVLDGVVLNLLYNIKTTTLNWHPDIS